MLQKKNLTNGICIIGKINSVIYEGVILDYDYAFYKYIVMWFVMNSDDNLYYSYQRSMKFSDIENLDYAYSPHFCKIKNIYEVLKKYDNNNMLLLGYSTINGTDEFQTDFLYLKINQNLFLELVICYPKKSMKYQDQDAVIWINEYHNIQQFHLNNGNYYFGDFIPVDIEDARDTLSTFNGVKFIDKKQHLQIGIYSHIDAILRHQYINGMDTKTFTYNNCIRTKEEFITKINKL